MHSNPIEALGADREVVLQLAAGLDGAGWQAASGCPGWSVQDLIAHLGALFWMVVDPSVLPSAADVPTEEAQELFVRARRDLGAAEVLADYEAVSLEALTRLAGLAELDFEVPLGDLGTYPARVVPNAFCFDHYTHIRADLFAPRGPLPGPLPPSDELRLRPALDWIEAALPQQNGKVLQALADPVDIVVTGPAARTIRLGGTGPVAASVLSEADSLVRWITQRATWEQAGVVATGDAPALELVRELKVF